MVVVEMRHLLVLVVFTFLLATALRAQDSFDPKMLPTPQAPISEQVSPTLNQSVPSTTDRQTPAPVTLRELSPWSMFLAADLLVKAVMVSLALASLISWTVFLAKSLQLRISRWRLNKSLARFSAARTLAEAQLALVRRRSVLTTLLAAAMQEVRMSADNPIGEGIKERAASRFSEVVRAEARAARQGMVMLATIGATAPFVGLFGTVWGIMNSFIGISKSQTTNLAVVAPGIAEALLATACGLAAAIPAVIFYNLLTRTLRSYLELVGRASGAATRVLSRDVDRSHERWESRAAE